MCVSSVSNVIYHKFSHGPAFYTLSGKNFNIILESMIHKIQVKAIYASLHSDNYSSQMFLYTKFVDCSFVYLQTELNTSCESFATALAHDGYHISTPLVHKGALTT